MTRLILLALVLAGPLAAQPAGPVVAPPAALTLDGVPPVPVALRAATQPYLEYRSATVVDWNPRTHGLLIATRFGNAVQLHEVARAGGVRTQLSFEDEPVTSGAYAPHRGDALVVSKDVGGGEFYQLYTLNAGRLTRLTDGASRNEGAVWDRDGNRVAYTSTRRNGTDSDIYLVDPRDPRSDHLVAKMTGNGWRVAAFAPGGGQALVEHSPSVEQSEVYEMDVATGAMTRLTAPGKVAWSGPTYGPDGTIYLTSDVGGEVARLGRLGRDGRFTPLNPEASWDVEDFAVADDGRFIAYVVNEAGVSRLRLLDPRTGRVRDAKLPAGVVSGLAVAPWGEVGFTLASATSPGDAFVLDPATLAVTQWTTSETGGLDPKSNRAPELVTIKSFDGVAVSGFLYRPDPAKFPGKRPLIVSIHGGPRASRVRASRSGATICSMNSASLSSTPTSAARPAMARRSSASTMARSSARIRSATSARFSTPSRPIPGSTPRASPRPAAVTAGICATRARSALRHASARHSARSRSRTSSPSLNTRKAIAATCAGSSTATSATRPARQAGRNFAADAHRRNQDAAVHRHRRQRPARTAQRGGAGGRCRAQERWRSMAHDRRRRRVTATRKRPTSTISSGRRSCSGKRTC